MTRSIADARPRAAHEHSAVQVRLEVGTTPDDPYSQLIIEAGNAIGDERGGQRETALALWRPGAVRALADALMQLALDPRAQRTLAAIRPRDATADEAAPAAGSGRRNGFAFPGTRSRANSRGRCTDAPRGSPVVLGRGVWIAQWQGPNGEAILIAVDRMNRQVGERMVAAGCDYQFAADQLWERLEAVDDAPVLTLVRE